MRKYTPSLNKRPAGEEGRSRVEKGTGIISLAVVSSDVVQVFLQTSEPMDRVTSSAVAWFFRIHGMNSKVSSSSLLLQRNVEEIKEKIMN